MTQEPFSRRQGRLLDLIAYLTLATVAAGALGVMLEGQDRWIAAALLLTFGLLLSRSPAPQGPPRTAHLYLAIQTVLVTCLLLLRPGWTLFPLLFFVLSAQAMLILPLRTAVGWLIFFVVVTGATFVHAVGWSTDLLVLPAYAAGYFFFGVFAQALARANAAHRESQALLAELQKAHRKLQEQALHAEEMAVIQERNRLAREMHDTLGHRLTVAAVQLEGAQRLIPRDPERAAQMVNTVRQQVREALSELRSTVAALRAPVETDLALPHALTRLATHFEEATGLTVHRDLPAQDGLPPLPETYRLALYRAAQEALTNVHKHAGAGQVWLVLALRERAIVLQVSDDGQGMASGGGQGFGLRGLQERAAQLGGELRIESRPGGGTTLSFRLPLDGTDARPGGRDDRTDPHLAGG